MRRKKRVEERGEERSRPGLCSGADADAATETHGGARSDQEDSGGSQGNALLHVVTRGRGSVGRRLVSVRSITVRDGGDKEREGLSGCVVVCIDFTSEQRGKRFWISFDREALVAGG